MNPSTQAATSAPDSAPPLTPPAPRLRCARCQRPTRTCLCGWVRPTAHTVPLLVLQHPREAGHAKGSLPLLQLSLQHCHVEVGKCFDPHALQTWLDAGAALLYPGPAATACGAADPPPTQLVLLDGTWRQTRQLLHLNPLLQRLPRLQLTDPAPSRYTIRKAQQAGQRSTLEAACLALSLLKDTPAHCAALLQAFEGWTAQQAATGAGRPTGPR
jgi:DTW domain-containing protein YfiP